MHLKYGTWDTGIPIGKSLNILPSSCFLLNVVIVLTFINKTPAVLFFLQSRHKGMMVFRLNSVSKHVWQPVPAH